MKALKIIGGIAIGYAVFNTLSLAYIGIGAIAKQQADTPYDSIMECNMNVIYDATLAIKKFLKK